MKILLICLSLSLACVSKQNCSIDVQYEMTLRISDSMKLSQCMESLETLGAKNWTAANSTLIGREISVEPQYLYTAEYYDLPNGILLSLWGKSAQKEIGDGDLSLDQYRLTALSVSNSRMLRAGKQAREYTVKEIQLSKDLHTNLVFLDKTKSFIYKGMLKEKAQSFLRSFKEVQPEPKALKTYLTLLIKERQKPYFPAPDRISKDDKWQMYDLENDYKFFIQFKKTSKSETVAAMFCVFPVDETYGRLSPTFQKGKQDYAVLEYELINIKKPVSEP